MSDPHPAQIKWKDPLALARYIRKRLDLIPEPVERLNKIADLVAEAMTNYHETPFARYHRLEEIRRLAQEKPALADPSVRLDMEAMCDAVERLVGALIEARERLIPLCAAAIPSTQPPKEKPPFKDAGDQIAELSRLMIVHANEARRFALIGKDVDELAHAALR